MELVPELKARVQLMYVYSAERCIEYTVCVLCNIFTSVGYANLWMMIT